MVLLQINATYEYGSTGRIVKDIDCRACESGFISYVACSDGPLQRNVYHIGNKLDHKIHALLCRFNGRQAYFSKKATRNLLDFIKEIKPDIVHLHNLHSNYINLNMLLDFFAMSEIAVVITMHDCWFYTGKCFHYTAVGCYKWRKGCHKCPKRKTDTPTWFIDKSHANLIDRKKRFERINRLYVVGASKWIAEEASQSILRKARISYCYNGVDTNVFRPKTSNLRKNLGIDNSSFVILGMANKWLIPQNTVYCDVIKTLIDDGKIIILIGELVKNTLDDRIIHVPTVKGAEKMAEWYSMANVFVNLTLEDTLPFVNIEAQACGTPVITHRTSGASETITDATGISFIPGSPDELVDAIEIIERNRKSHYSKACVDRVQAIFNKKNAYDEYFRIYEEIENGEKSTLYCSN